MDTYLITPSLLNSFSYYMDAGEEWEDNAKADFWLALKKLTKSPTESMLNGIEFENKVYQRAAQIESHIDRDDDINNKVDACVEECALIVAGGVFQPILSKRMMVDGQSFLLYGNADAVKGDRIYDIKFTQNYDMGKYFRGSQGPCYLECLEDLEYFTYLVCDGSNVYVEQYRRSELYTAEYLIRQFWQMMKAVPEMIDTYIQLWKARE